MPQRLTIKQIAELAGVSAGTVDRVLHNRGMVSESALDAINRVLEKNKYEYNLHTSAVAFKKTKKVIRLLVAIPFSDKGEYWDLIREGIAQGLNEFNDIPIECEYVFFDQFDSDSCRKAFESISETECSAVILGTTFSDEVQELCKVLDGRKTPYAFVDGNVPGTKPIATCAADQTCCGRLLARLIDGFTPDDAEIAILLPKRKGTQMSTNSSIRLKAFKEYFIEAGKSCRLKEGSFSISDFRMAVSDIGKFLEENPLTKGIAVVISASYLVCDALSELSLDDICVGGFDITDGNVRCVKNGSLDYLINQHPDRQGFNAVEAVLHFLLYGKLEEQYIKKTPVDIVFRENLQTIQDI